MMEIQPQDLDKEFQNKFDEYIKKWGDSIKDGSNLGNIKIEYLTDEDKTLFINFIEYIEFGTFDADMQKSMIDKMDPTFLIKILLRIRDIKDESRNEEEKLSSQYLVAYMRNKLSALMTEWESDNT